EYEENPNWLSDLNGKFHGLLIDSRQAEAILFIDRYGLNRVYYHETKDAFFLSAEAKAILKVCPEVRELDKQSLGEFIKCGCALDNRSLFKGIQILPPASAWTFRNGALERKDSYFNISEWEQQSALGPEDYYQALKQAFTESLPRYFNGPEKVGVSLTGGLDSRMIMAWSKADPGTLPCYSFGGTYRDCEDVKLARRVARVCGQPHEVI